MVDVSVGTDTRKMVGSVSKYFVDNIQPREVFYKCNNELGYKLIALLRKIQSEKQIQELRELKQICLSYRKIFKQIGNDAGCSTEPDSITPFLDKLLLNNDDIYYAICPGAGGYDAICIITGLKVTS